MSGSGRAVAFLTTWRDGYGKPHDPGHEDWGADECARCVADAFDPWEALVWAAGMAWPERFPREDGQARDRN